MIHWWFPVRIRAAADAEHALGITAVCSTTFAWRTLRQEPKWRESCGATVSRKIMPLYRRQGEAFVPFEKTPFADLERVLEDWIEANPHLLLADEPLAILGRQVRTGENKVLDLLALDRTGATVIIELKRGETPREVVAQALEYAAWVDTLSLESLDSLAHTYGERAGREYASLAELYQHCFSDDLHEEDTEHAEALLPPINERQRVVIVAEAFSAEVERTLRYLRTRHGMNIAGVRFGIHTAGGETIVETEVVVGREQQVVAAQKAPRALGMPGQAEPPEVTAERVRTDFLRRAVTAIPEWVRSLGVPGLVVTHGSRSDYDIKLGSRNILHYYFAEQWALGRFSSDASPDLERRLKDGLSKPADVQRDSRGALRFHITTDADLKLVKTIVLERIEALRGGLGATIPAG